MKTGNEKLLSISKENLRLNKRKQKSYIDGFFGKLINAFIFFCVLLSGEENAIEIKQQYERAVFFFFLSCFSSPLRKVSVLFIQRRNVDNSVFVQNDFDT